MDFIIGLSISINQKNENYNSILVIIDRPIKIIYYKPIKVNIDILCLIKVIINIVVHHHSLSNSIISNCGSVFTSKFQSSLCYFLGIKSKLSIAFYFQTDKQKKRQNSIIEAYFPVFVNYKQENQIRLLVIAKFTKKNAKQANTSYIHF